MAQCSKPPWAPYSSCAQQLRQTSRVRRGLFTLATQTQGTSWFTVEQLIYREDFDETKIQYDPFHTPLKSWPDKVAAALAACQHVDATGKDGAFLWPVAPGVA